MLRNLLRHRRKPITTAVTCVTTCLIWAARAQILGRNVTSLFLCIGLLRSRAFALEDLQAPTERLYRNSRSLGSLDRVTDRRGIPRRTICSFHIGSIARIVQLHQRFSNDIHTMSRVTVSAGEAANANSGANLFTLAGCDGPRTDCEPVRSSNA